MNDPWFWTAPRSRPATVRLICLPHAGGGSVVFQPWAKELPEWVEVASARLPGRESRMREPLVTDWRAIVGPLADSIAAAPPVPALAIYGHSMGAILGHELAHALAARGIAVNLLMVSGRCAPGRTNGQQLHTLPEDEFLRCLLDLYGGVPREVLEHRELMEIFLPILRADLQLVETYRHADRPPAPWPITAFGGAEDRSVGRDELEEWRALTASHFELRMFAGGHFFIQSDRAALLANVREQLQKWCVTRP
jgi:surfactin synthase thioesterase subunit